MQAGSTGLGNMTLWMNVIDESEVTRMPPTSPPENSLVVYCKTYDPVVWNVWISVEPEELPALLRQLFKPKLLWFVLKALASAPFKSRIKVATPILSPGGEAIGGEPENTSNRTKSVKNRIENENIV